MADEEIRERHESYALVQFSRRSGNPGRLFGSALRTHESFVTLHIKRGEVIHSLGYDRYFGNMRGDLIEVDMSAAQFAELLTTMNIGCGVPCTLRYFDNKKVADPPDAPVEVEKIRTSFKEEVRRHVASMRSEMAGLKDLLEKKSLGKADREAIMAKFQAMLRKYEDSAPFMLSQFEEATEKVVQHAKAEVDAFVANNVVAEGLRALAAKAESAPKELPAKGEEEP